MSTAPSENESQALNVNPAFRNYPPSCPIPLVGPPNFDFVNLHKFYAEGEAPETRPDLASAVSGSYFFLDKNCVTHKLPNSSQLPDTTKRDRLVEYHKLGQAFYGISVLVRDGVNDRYYCVEQTEDQLKALLQCEDDGSVDQRIRREVASDLGLDGSKVCSERQELEFADEGRRIRGVLKFWSAMERGTDINHSNTKHYIEMNDYRGGKLSEFGICRDELKELAKYSKAGSEVFARVRGYESASSVGANGSVNSLMRGNITWETSPVKDEKTGNNAYSVFLPGDGLWWVTEESLEAIAEKLSKETLPRYNDARKILDDIREVTYQDSRDFTSDTDQTEPTVASFYDVERALQRSVSRLPGGDFGCNSLR